MSFDLSWLWTGQNETDRGAALDAALRAQNTADYSPGGRLYTPLNWEIAQAHLAAQEADTASYNSQVASAAADGARTGLQGVIDLVKNPFLGIPVAWWLIGAGVLFWWLGGLTWIRGALKKKA